MEFKFKPLEPKESLNCVIGVPVSEGMYQDLVRIKRDKKHNPTILNQYIRDFINQMIEAYDNGELEK